MAERWYIVEQFGKVGPFSLRDLMSSVERGDYDYSITIESEETQKRTTLAELLAARKKKKQRRAKPAARSTVDADSTRIVPSESKHRSLEADNGGGYSEPAGRHIPVGRNRRTADIYIERRPSRGNKKFLLIMPAMLAGGILSLILFFGLQKLTNKQGQSNTKTAKIVDLPLEPEEIQLTEDYAAAEEPRREVIYNVKTARQKKDQVVLIGPVVFSRSELYRCRIKCKLGFRDRRGGHITGVFFAQAFKNKLLAHSGRVVIKGRISADGEEIYLQSISP